MAILKCQWKLDEGSGLTVADTSPAGYHNDGVITKVGDYPKWVTASNGQPAIENDGSSIRYPGDLWGGPRITTELETLYDLDCDMKFAFWSMYVKAMVPVGAPDNPRPMLTVMDLDYPYYLYTTAATAIYMGLGGVPGFGITFYINQTRHTLGVAAPRDIRDGQWHEYLVLWDDAFATYPADDYHVRARMRLFIDGVEEAWRDIPWTYTVTNPIRAHEFTIGWGTLGFGSMYGEMWPGLSYYSAQSYGGAFYGQVQDARFYCGVVNPDDLYPPPPSIVGNCLYPSTSRACSPMSESSICAPRSSVRLIPSNR